MIKLKSVKPKVFLLIIVILIPLLLNLFITNLNMNNKVDHFTKNEDNDEIFQNENLKIQDLETDNTYYGIGAPWNVTHWANRTDYNLPISFTNNSYDIAEIPLGSGWEGYKLNATIKNLYDTRNWCNGTFNFGTDDNIETPDDDTELIENIFQNWTFGYEDIITYPAPPPPDWFVNPMSGNYLDASYGPTDGHNCLELRIDGMDISGDYYYDQGDKCWWNSSFQIPRGRIIDSELKFEVKANHMMDFNDFELRFYLNNKKIYSIGAFNIKEVHGTSWGNFSIPQGLWTNSLGVYTNPVNVSTINIKIELMELIECGYGSGFTNYDFQQIFIDNVKLIVKAEAKPSQVQLKMNDHEVNDIDWGIGTVKQESNWTSSIVQANFTSDNTGELTGFEIDLKTDLNLYARKETPETNYETNTDSLGTQFSVSNNSLANWEFYAYFSVPNGYEENKMRINFPSDITLTWASEPQDPNTNILSECNISIPGLLIIPVNTISSIPNGFWKFKAISPNYCEQLNIFNNATGIWSLDDEFVSGDYINITAKITDSSLVSGYLHQTKVQLNIRFPNGTIWHMNNQIKTPNSNGYVYFDYFQIPNSPPNYEVGEYEAIILWNNSYSTYDLNETGIIYKKFYVIHNSILNADQNVYEDIYEGNTLNLKVSFNDRENFHAIENAQIYLDNFLSAREYFSEISPGYYFLEFNTTGGLAGNNILWIYANSSLYENNQLNITIELIQATVLTAEEYPNIQIMWNENFTIHLNYTTKLSGIGISTIPTNNWIGETYTLEINPGEYNIICNTSMYEVNKFHSLIIYTDTEGYESKSIIIGVLITKRQVNMSVYIDSFKIQELFQVEKSFNEILSVSVRISDNITSNYIPGEVLTLICENFIVNISYTGNFWYNISINCSPSKFSLGLNFVNIRLIKENYDICVFSFQLLINQIELKIDPVNFEDSLSAKIGGTINIQIKLLDPITNNSIENAYISYSWDYGLGTLNETTPGLYQTFIALPENLQGVYTFKLIITPENSTYKTMQYSFIVIIGETITEKPKLPNYFLWIIIGILISVASILGALSLRSYIILPRKRKKEAELLSETQRFKDIRNIQAIVIIHKLSGIPLFSKSYSILEKHKKELFSGFIQAITTIGEEFTEKDSIEHNIKDSTEKYVSEKLMELDFRYFYCLIADSEELRIVLILKEKSSERLRNQTKHLLLALSLNLTQQLENWDGSLDQFENLIPPIINDYFELYYKETFKLNIRDFDYIKMKKERGFTKLEIRVLNVIESVANTKDNIINLDTIINLVHEENKDLIIKAIESLIEHKIIVPINI